MWTSFYLNLWKNVSLEAFFSFGRHLVFHRHLEFFEITTVKIFFYWVHIIILSTKITFNTKSERNYTSTWINKFSIEAISSLTKCQLRYYTPFFWLTKIHFHKNHTEPKTLKLQFNCFFNLSIKILEYYVIHILKYCRERSVVRLVKKLKIYLLTLIQWNWSNRCYGDLLLLL